MAMVSDDFSFPTMSYQLPNLAVTPSLWRVSSTVYPADYCEESNEGELLAAEEGGDDQYFSECEEKMDMLWEAFNEELKRVCSLKDRKMKMKERDQAAAVRLSNEQSAAGNVKMVEVCCRQAAGNSTGMITYDKRSGKSAVLVIKFLKKLLLMTAAQIKKN